MPTPFLDVEAFIEAAPWRFAKSMPHIPHEYIVRGQVPDDQFEAFIQGAGRRQICDKIARSSIPHLLTPFGAPGVTRPTGNDCQHGVGAGYGTIAPEWGHCTPNVTKALAAAPGGG
jgi:hypothetical protein